MQQEHMEAVEAVSLLEYGDFHTVVADGSGRQRGSSTGALVADGPWLGASPMTWAWHNTEYSSRPTNNHADLTLCRWVAVIALHQVQSSHIRSRRRPKTALAFHTAQTSDEPTYAAATSSNLLL